MMQEKSAVLWNTIECSGYFRIGLRSSENLQKARPGQFVMVRIGDRIAPLLRRPFSIHRIIENDNGAGGFEILYKVVGKGTELMSMLSKGDAVDVIGPLGNCFRMPEKGSRVCIVCGGIGVAPMFFLTSRLLKEGIAPSDCVVFIGGRSKDDLLCMNDFVARGIEKLHITTDDGTAGLKELVTGPLNRHIASEPPNLIYACGPVPMLKAVAEIARKRRIPCQISVESLMACGVGACLGCALNGTAKPNGYLHVCADGPVFNSEDIVLSSR